MNGLRLPARLLGAALAFGLVALVPGYAPAPPPCWGGCPPSETPTEDVYIAASGYTPQDVTVELGTIVYFYNLDATTDHTVTDKRCADDANVACAFDVRLPFLGTVDPRSPFVFHPTYYYGNNKVRTYPGYAHGQTYEYVCRIHEGMAGRIIVR